MDARIKALYEHVIARGLHGSLLNTISSAKGYSGVLHVVILAGGFSALAKTLGVSYQVVQKWYARGFVPTTRVAILERLYGVPREELIHPKHRGSK